MRTSRISVVNQVWRLRSAGHRGSCPAPLLPHEQAVRRGGPPFLARRVCAAIIAGCCALAGHAADACEDAGELADFVSSRYGDAIAFDVVRNGKRVGEHVTRFTHDGEGIAVESNMQLAIRILGIPVYRFSYLSRARWCDDGLAELDAHVNDNGDESHTHALRQDGRLLVRHGGREERVPAGLMPTDHWNPRVIDERRVLNTLTGNVNDVAIVPCARGEALVEQAAPGSACYAYTGDLETRAWYSRDGRWSGLAFEGSDGSQILYLCRDCARTAF